MIVYDRYGQVVSREDHIVQLNVKPDVYPVFQKNGVQLHGAVSAPNGDYWLRTGIYDERTRKVGTMEVPFAWSRTNCEQIVGCPQSSELLESSAVWRANAELLYYLSRCRTLFGYPTFLRQSRIPRRIRNRKSALRPGSSVVERGPEKAGVGGSIPSLATIRSNSLGVLRESPSTLFHP